MNLTNLIRRNFFPPNKAIFNRERDYEIEVKGNKFRSCICQFRNNKDFNIFYPVKRSKEFFVENNFTNVEYKWFDTPERCTRGSLARI